MRTVTVVGASLAGLSTARALRDQGFEGRLVVVGDEVHRPYDRPPLSKDFLAGRVDTADLSLEDDDDDLAVDWLLGEPAVRLDAADRSVMLADGTRLRTDGLVIATGARARTLPGAGELAGVHTLRTLNDALALRHELVAGARLVVIGAGFVGAEVASTAHRLGLDVTVVEAMPTPLAGPLGVEMGRVVAGLHADHGVRLVCGAGVVGLSGRDRVEQVELADGRLLPADVVLVGVGAAPNVEWLAGSGLTLADGIVCDASGATCLPGVVAVGDCASWFDGRQDRHSRVEHWTGARERPAAAVARLLGAAVAPGGPPSPYFWSDQYDVRIQFAGRTNAVDTLTVEDGSVEARSFLAVYRRGDEPVGVLAMNSSRLFGRWRRQLPAAPSVASVPVAV